MYNIRMDVEEDTVFNLETLTLLTDHARMASTHFNGMGFNIGEIVFNYEDEPIQATDIRNNIECIVKANEVL